MVVLLHLTRTLQSLLIDNCSDSAVASPVEWQGLAVMLSDQMIRKILYFFDILLQSQQSLFPTN